MTSSDLLAAIEAGQLETVRALLAAEPELATAQDDDGVSALMHAMYRGHRPRGGADRRRAAVARRVRGGGARQGRRRLGPDRRRHLARHRVVVDGFTALHFAAFFGGAEAARVLLGAGADANLRSRNDFAVMPIHSAVAGRHGDVVAALLDAGADPNVRQRHGWTPLQGAAQLGDTETIDRLLAAGADPVAANDAGVTAADLARKAGHADLAERLAGLAGATTSAG